MCLSFWSSCDYRHAPTCLILEAIFLRVKQGLGTTLSHPCSSGSLSCFKSLEIIFCVPVTAIYIAFQVSIGITIDWILGDLWDLKDRVGHVAAGQRSAYFLLTFSSCTHSPPKRGCHHALFTCAARPGAAICGPRWGPLLRVPPQSQQRILTTLPQSLPIIMLLCARWQEDMVTDLFLPPYIFSPWKPQKSL
jgi:hypothetical protein